jgi:hypothetical protein
MLTLNREATAATARADGCPSYGCKSTNGCCAKQYFVGSNQSKKAVFGVLNGPQDARARKHSTILTHILQQIPCFYFFFQQI